MAPRCMWEPDPSGPSGSADDTDGTLFRGWCVAENDTGPDRVSSVLASARPAGPAVMERLLPLIYDDLRVMAHRQLAREYGKRTLVTTDLVHEAYLKLVDQSRVIELGRSYFFGAAARAMRQILVDRARSRKRLKRGADAERVTLDAGIAAEDRFSIELLDLDRALEQLAELSPRQVRVVECRYFAGMTVAETAEALAVSARTIKQDWTLARAWLHSVLRVDKGRDHGGAMEPPG